MACALRSDWAYQPGHSPSLIRVFAVRLKKSRILSYPLSAQQRLWSDWADAKADLSHRWAHMPFRWYFDDAAQILFVPDVYQNYRHLLHYYSFPPPVLSKQPRCCYSQPYQLCPIFRLQCCKCARGNIPPRMSISNVVRQAVNVLSKLQ